MRIDEITEKDLQSFKTDVIRSHIKAPKSVWALSKQEGVKNGIPSHILEYFDYSQLVQSINPLELISHLDPFYREKFLSKKLFQNQLEVRKIYRIWNLWQNNVPVYPAYLRLHERENDQYSLEIVEENHRIKLSITNKSNSIPVLFEQNEALKNWQEKYPGFILLNGKTS